MLWYHTVYCFTDNQSLKEQGRRTHIHIPHTLLVPHSLIHCCHGNPIKGGQSGNNSGEIILSPFYLSLSLSFFHTHASTFPFFHCQPFLFCLPPLLFPSSPIVLLLLSLHHPWHTSLAVSLHYYATFSSFHLQAPTSQVNVNMSSHFSKPHCIYS